MFSSAAVRLFGSLAALQQTRAPPVDTVVVESPLPGGAAQLTRFLLNTVPPWVQIGGVIVGALVAIGLGILLVRRRRRIVTWFSVQSRAAKIAIAVVVSVLIVSTVAAGAATWDYTQHSNDFCTGCHVMNPAFSQFASDSNKHAELNCHDCHQQPLSASARQLYLWVAERPERIGEHAPVPNRVCETCHVTGDTATWQRIASTAGHRTHLESDSSSLKDLQCVSCHGVEVHSFKPVSETCGTSGCHSTEDTDIVLGRMSTQTAGHCAACHQFTADVPALATRDSAVTTLMPGRAQCLGCHEMRAVLADFDEGKDPHGGKCGLCHNPHTQKTAAAAVTSCATCHANWRDEPFHTGASHRRVAEQCLTCHVAHKSKVDASECQGCHESVRARGRLRPPVRFDTSAALRRGDTAATASLSANAGHAPVSLAAAHATFRVEPPVESPPDLPETAHRGGPFVPDAGDDAMLFASPAAAPDSFAHARHQRIACLVCHQTGTGHGRLTFERPRGCAICHHQAPRQARCATCHQPEEYGAPKAKTVTITVSGHAPNPRDVEFVHSQHAARQCVECHTTPVTLALAPEKAQCSDCHTEHHTVDRNCSSCHRIAEPGRAHTSPEIAHRRCDACHERATVEQLTPTRSFCGTCHAAQRTNHYEPRECTVCHFLAEPAVHRTKLLTAPPG